MVTLRSCTRTAAWAAGSASFVSAINSPWRLVAASAMPCKRGRAEHREGGESTDDAQTAHGAAQADALGTGGRPAAAPPLPPRPKASPTPLVLSDVQPSDAPLPMSTIELTLDFMPLK